MNRSASRALFLVLGCVCYRLFFATHPEWLPNISPLIAVAFVGAMYLPRPWGWLVGPAVFVLTDLALLTTNRAAEGWMFSWASLAFLAFYALAGGWGTFIARHKSLAAIMGGSILCSVTFYVLANTFAWWGDLSSTAAPGYSPTLAGWWQANTVGLPGWQPTWTFLRNGLLGDLAFSLALVAIFDRALFLHTLQQRTKTVAA